MSRPEAVRIRTPQSVADDIAQINERILRRAYEIFQNRGGVPGSDLNNWLEAESELVWRPPIELTEKEKEFILTVAVPGVDPKDIEIEATPDEIVVKAEFQHEHTEGTGNVHSCEFQCGSVFRTVPLPKKVDPEHVKAQLKHGILKIYAPISEERIARKVDVSAA